MTCKCRSEPFASVSSWQAENPTLHLELSSDSISLAFFSAELSPDILAPSVQVEVDSADTEVAAAHLAELVLLAWASSLAVVLIQVEASLFRRL